MAKDLYGTSLPNNTLCVFHTVEARRLLVLSRPTKWFVEYVLRNSTVLIEFTGSRRTHNQVGVRMFDLWRYKYFRRPYLSDRRGNTLGCCCREQGSRHPIFACGVCGAVLRSGVMRLEQGGRRPVRACGDRRELLRPRATRLELGSGYPVCTRGDHRAVLRSGATGAVDVRTSLVCHLHVYLVHACLMWIVAGSQSAADN